jgi:hypothetical protein
MTVVIAKKVLEPSSPTESVTGRATHPDPREVRKA